MAEKDTIFVGLEIEEWGQAMMVLQGGIYRVVAPLLNKISTQIQQAQMLQAAQQQGIATQPPAKLGLVPKEGEQVDVSDTLPAAE
jgi:hypothetical protein